MIQENQKNQKKSKVLNEKIIILGDLHFGVKGFSDSFFDNQLKFFNKQLFPYMKENNIQTIIQLGDWLDNRKNIDIKFFNRICSDFCEQLVENDFKFITFLGNHDIYYNSRLDINLVKYFERLYPKNIEVIEEFKIREFNDVSYGFMPWLVDSKVAPEHLAVDILFGHFEIKDFEMVKGHKDSTSELTSNSFKNGRLKRVISGHYHIQSTDGFVLFAGTPYQINWGDYDTPRGFFVISGTDLEFFENTKSKKFIKIKYDDTNELPLEIKGAGEIIRTDNLESAIERLEGNNIKFFVNSSQDKRFEENIFELHKNNLSVDVINNVEISNLIGTDYVHDDDSKTAIELILETVKKHKPNLLKKVQGILQEIV